MLNMVKHSFKTYNDVVLFVCLVMAWRYWGTDGAFWLCNWRSYTSNVAKSIVYLQLRTLVTWWRLEWKCNQLKDRAIDVLHGSHVAWQEQCRKYFARERTFFPIGKRSYCSCHTTWLPCKTSVMKCLTSNTVKQCVIINMHWRWKVRSMYQDLHFNQ